MKYIEAEKLIRAIEDKGLNCSFAIKMERLDTLALIDSLQLETEIEMEWDSFSKHLAKYGEESESVVWLNWYNFDEIARHFYNLGFNARKA